LSTIISRTQPVRVPPIGIDKIARALEEKYQLNAQDAMRIAQMSQGNYITAQSLIGETENPYFDQWRNWMNLCYAKKMPQLMEWSESMSGLGREALKSFLLYGMEILRGVLVYGFTATANTWIGQEKEFVERFSKLGMPVSAIEKIVVALEMAIANLERNASPKLILTDLSFSVAKNLKK
jgi:DNA polymerase-3 subunit delta'